MPRKRIRSVRPELNLTSMLDVVFNLITFFILITNFAAAELPRLANSVPRPDQSIAQESTRKNRVIVSVLPEGTTGRSIGVQVGSARQDLIRPDDYAKLTDRLAKEKQINKDVVVTLRADRAIQ